MNDSYVEKSIDSGRIGAAVEHLVAASCILASGGALNVSTSLVDDEGVDLVFHRRGSPTTLAVQVKSRSKDTSVVQRGQFVAYVLALESEAVDAGCRMASRRIVKTATIPEGNFT